MLDLIATGLAILPATEGSKRAIKPAFQVNPQLLRITSAPLKPVMTKLSAIPQKSDLSGTSELSIDTFKQAGLELTRQDLAFLSCYLPFEPNKRSMTLKEYRAIWLDAMAHESMLHRQQNRGRFAANTWLRERKARRA
jgi:hypothetical protein